MKRIFTAIDISDSVRQKISIYIEDLRREFSNVRVGWDKPEKLHLTLKFLGDIDEKRLVILSEAVETTASRISNFNLQIKDTGVFPSKKNGRILLLGVKGETEILQTLNEILENECQRNAFAKETRNFKPHLTIARLREPRKSKELVARHLQNEFESNEFEASEITIYESHLQKSGSIYRKVSGFELNQTPNLKPET
ncbi:MAG: RNA 2',3'-cyclic phosphodiesterase [Pyrinomonadaceae bacterium]